MTRTNDLVPAFDRFREKINAAYDQAREMLASGDLEGCYDVLTRINTVHAQNATSMYRVCVRRGLMRGEE